MKKTNIAKQKSLKRDKRLKMIKSDRKLNKFNKRQDNTLKTSALSSAIDTFMWNKLSHCCTYSDSCFKFKNQMNNTNFEDLIITVDVLKFKNTFQPRRYEIHYSLNTFKCFCPNYILYQTSILGNDNKNNESKSMDELQNTIEEYCNLVTNKYFPLLTNKISLGTTNCKTYISCNSLGELKYLCYFLSFISEPLAYEKWDINIVYVTLYYSYQLKCEIMLTCIQSWLVTNWRTISTHNSIEFWRKISEKYKFSQLHQIICNNP